MGEPASTSEFVPRSPASTGAFARSLSGGRTTGAGPSLLEPSRRRASLRLEASPSPRLLHPWTDRKSPTRPRVGDPDSAAASELLERLRLSRLLAKDSRAERSGNQDEDVSETRSSHRSSTQTTGALGTALAAHPMPSDSSLHSELQSILNESYRLSRSLQGPYAPATLNSSSMTANPLERQDRSAQSSHWCEMITAPARDTDASEALNQLIEERDIDVDSDASDGYGEGDDNVSDGELPATRAILVEETEENFENASDELNSVHEFDGSSMSQLSNRDINVSKATALKNAMLRNLVRLGFDEDLSETSLEAGIREIDQYDSDCELAYADVFIALVKMVCDAHSVRPRVPGQLNSVYDQEDIESSVSFPLPFKWPVFDMAQFEFGNARTGTCFESVCVLVNLPKVSMDRAEELMELLSCYLFSMLGDPIQVVIPSVSATGRTKGHAFLEFDDPTLARTCVSAVDGLTWGRGPFGRIRANMFRQYQVKAPPVEESLTDVAIGSWPQHIDASQPRSPDADFRFSRELMREDLTTSGASSNSSWNASSQLSGFGGPVHSSLMTIDDAIHQARDDIMRLGELRLSSDEEGSSTTESDLDLEDLEDGRVGQSSGENGPQFTQTPSLGQSSLPLAPSVSLSSDTHVEAEGPWRAYCEEILASNRDMQDQIAYARRRIAALGHNNQKLHLLIDRMERDRDGLIFENDLLQTQLHGYENNERQQEALMQELEALRRRMRRRDARIERGFYNSRGLATTQSRAPIVGVTVELELGVIALHELEDQLGENIVASRRLDDLKVWEQMLESSLARVRSIKEEIAMELQKKLDQQAEDQLQDHKLCVICLSKEKSILCLPCRHLCLCQDCSQHQELDKCPICRLVVESMLLVYA